MLFKTMNHSDCKSTPSKKNVPLHSIALVGNPNSGKTALFNRLTGSHQKVANYAGVTVERKEGKMTTDTGQQLHVIDLPGIYSLTPLTKDEEVTQTALLDKTADIPVDLIVYVADATNLKRNLKLILDVIALGHPTILALNMTDLARKRGQIIDLELLQQELGIPVVETIAIESNGIGKLLEILNLYACNGFPANAGSNRYGSEKKSSTLESRRILDNVIKKHADTYTLNQKIDALVLHPVFGFPILVIILFFMFQAVFSWAEVPMEWIENGIGATGEFLATMLPDGILRSLVVDGIIAGIGSIIVFLPQILILFFFILILEESGYLPRAAFMMDKMMSSIGLSGHAFIPLLSSFACAVPGIMATRTIKNPKDRIITILIAPLMTCSARLPVYSLIIGAFIPTRTVGLFNLQGLVLFGLYISGIFAAVMVAWVLNRLLGKNDYQPLLMELPSYHLPRMRNIAIGLWERARIFLIRVSTIIFATSVLLWVLSSYPVPPEGTTGTAIQYSFAGRLGHLIEYIVQPIGFNWQIAVALIPGMAAREIAVSALGTVYALSASGDDLSITLAPLISSNWSLPTALSLLAWFVFAPQCFATLGVIRRETNSWKMMFFAIIYLFGLAYLASLATYHISCFLLDQ